MRFNNNFSVKNLFMNKELASVFPQFSKSDNYSDVRNNDWVERKMQAYLVKMLGGKMRQGDIILNGTKQEKMSEIMALIPIVQQLFNKLPSVFNGALSPTKKLWTPFISIDQIKENTSLRQKVSILQIVLDNFKYNPDFEQKTEKKTHGFYKAQKEWMKKVGLR